MYVYAMPQGLRTARVSGRTNEQTNERLGPTVVVLVALSACWCCCSSYNPTTSAHHHQLHDEDVLTTVRTSCSARWSPTATTTTTRPTKKLTRVDKGCSAARVPTFSSSALPAACGVCSSSSSFSSSPLPPPPPPQPSSPSSSSVFSCSQPNDSTTCSVKVPASLLVGCPVPRLSRSVSARLCFV